MKVVRKIHKVAISTEYIPLDAFLKLSGAVLSGGEAKFSVQNGEVTLNGEICTQRGKKLTVGDKVDFNGRLYEVTDEG